MISMKSNGELRQDFCAVRFCVRLQWPIWQACVVTCKMMVFRLFFGFEKSHFQTLYFSVIIILESCETLKASKKRRRGWWVHRKFFEGKLLTSEGVKVIQKSRVIVLITKKERINRTYVKCAQWSLKRLFFIGKYYECMYQPIVLSIHDFMRYRQKLYYKKAEPFYQKTLNFNCDGGRGQFWIRFMNLD